jgi:Fur family ferric uptake transcriptional regulator
MFKASNAERMLKSKGVSVTPLRLSVLGTLISAGKCLMAKEILKQVGSINKVTVYRILEKLVKVKLVRKFSIKRTFYYKIADKNHKPHPHLVCNICGKVRCLDTPELMVILSNLCKLYGFQADNINVSIEGVCNECSKQHSCR